MPLERDAASPATPPKLEMIRLEDRLTPVGNLTADALLNFAPNPVLDLGTTSPIAPVGTASVSSTPASTPATVAPVLAPNQYELVLPTTDASMSPSADSSGGSFALFSIVPPPPAASLSGFVYVDEGANGGTRDDGVKQAGEPGIQGTTITLLRVINNVTITASQTTTDASGFYQFPSLSPFGEYQVMESNQPAGFLDGKDTAGTIGGVTRGVAGNETITGITLNPLDVGVNYNFGELLAVQPTGALSGYVYEDEGANGGTRDDGVKQAGETPIPGATVTLFRIVNGQTLSVSQTTTDAAGFYRFTALPAAGGYIVRETQPANYTDGKDTPGSTGGTNSANDELSAISVPANGESFNNNFGELIQRGALSGYVYVDEGANGGTRDDGVKQAGEAVIPGTTVTLFRAVNGQTVSVSQTITDAAGFYRFTNLVAGAGYIVRETQPATFNDGKDTPGSTGGTNSANDELSAISVPVNGESFNNNFGELFVPIPPARLSGFVYEDPDNDGVKDAGEAAIPGTTVTLFRVVNGVTTSAGQTTTDGNGFYSFTALEPGTYEVRETQPATFLDGKDTAGSKGGAVTNDKISSIVLVPNDDSVNNNFGELRPARLSGFEYVDEGANGGTRDDGIKQAGETPIPGTVVVLTGTDDLGAVARTATTAGDGSYAFENLRPGTYAVNASQPAAFNDGKDTAGSKGGTVTNDQIAGIPIVAGDNSVNNNFGELLQQGTLSGFVYVDPNDNGAKESGEAPIPGTTVTLFRVVNGQTTSLSQTTTDASGFYQFTGLTPGTGYMVRETQPAGFNDGKDTPGSTGGTNSANDELSAITVPANGSSQNNNFGELVQTGALSGYVYVDEGANGGTRDDGIKQAGETPIPGATVTLFRVVNGQTTSVSQTTTDAAGFYRFANLTPGAGYLVRETQPANFNDGKDTPGSTGGSNAVNDDLSAVSVPANGESLNNNFGELVVPVGRLSGFVFEDLNDNGIKDPNEPGIAGVAVGITGQLANGQLWPPSIALTDANGFYEFTGLPAGTYRVDEVQPTAYLDGKDTPGSTGGTATNDLISAIPVPAGANSVNNNFGERRGSISGFVYVDEGANGGTRDDGIKQPGEAPIAGVVVRLLKDGVVQATVTSGVDGSYRFDGLLLGGGYTVQETAQPAGFNDGKDTAGVPGGGIAGNEVISNITLTQLAPNSPNNNFGELIPPPVPGALSGYVYVDEGANGGTRDDGVRQPGETPIPGTPVTLFRVVNGQTVSVSQTTTDANGFYRFANLTPGAGYLVRETQPLDLIDGKDTPGTTGGSNAVNDELSAVTVPANGESFNNNFGELFLPPSPPVPAQLAGFVYEDLNDDGVKDAGEADIPGATVTLFRVLNGQTVRVSETTTDFTGYYEFLELEPGTYVVRETQPAGFLDGKDTPGSTGGDAGVNDQIAAIVLVPNDNSLNNNFGELRQPPLPAPAQLSGFVYVDANNNGIKDPGEAGIPGATVRVGGVRTDGTPTGILAATTDANGFYSFPNLPAGSYGVQEVQPAGYLDGLDTPGSTGGGAPQNDTLVTVPLPPGANSVNNNFGELLPPPPPPSGSVNGFVYEDNNDNGVKDPGEASIPGTPVRLTNGTTTLTTTTDGNGFYQFLNLTPGQYTLIESQPASYLDGQDTPGSTGGNNSVNDVLSAVTVPAGGVSANNNYGELKPVSLYGYVWYDANENGRFDPVEIGLPGATVTLTGTTASGRSITTALAGGNPLSVTTDAFGRYAFPVLPAGNYAVVQTNTPAGYTDFREENAARLTVSSSTNLQFQGVVLNRNAGPLNFGKVNSSIIVVPPTPNPQNPDTPSKANFLGSSGTTAGVTVASSTAGRLLPAAEAGPFNPSALGTSTGRRIYAVGSGAGSASVVRVFDAATGGELFRVNPFESAFQGGVTTAIGDVNGDGFDDLIVGAAAGGGPRVRVFDGNTGATLYDFFAYPSSFTGGVWLASGDVNGDGFDDIITGAGAGGSPHVKAISGRTGQDIYSFFAFDQSYTGGARVAVGDFNGDGVADIAAGTGAGVASQVTTFNGLNAAVLNRFTPYNAGFLGGVNLAAGDVNGDGIAELITGAGAGGGPHVRVLNATTGASVYEFFAADTSFGGGVSVAAHDLNGDGLADIVTGTGPGAQARVQVFSGANLASLDNFFAFESTNKGGIYVG